MSKVITYYLEMTAPTALHEKVKPANLTIQEAIVKQYQFNRFLYQLVGEQWGWTDKLLQSDSQWQQYSEKQSLRTWAAYVDGSIAGYYELEQQLDGNIEIAYLGLAPKFIGQALGGYLLTHAVRSAWGWPGTKRVWLHTCSLDHASALNNYKARGFNLYRETSN